ncbi:MAG: mitochondrial K+-H+ exchange-related-domain-containing protein [Monoraphidium minutum]|nr:MAG: mitochondrial K+-H+ exchange-related-domain-containing protein [Monoraphidium minutum]
MAHKAQVLVIPVFRRAWLQHVCSGAAAHGPPAPPWHAGATLGDKARLAAAALQDWGAAKVDKQWHAIQTAREGSMNSYLYKLAQFVLRRVDPDESFLKGLPQGATALEFHYPAGVDPRLVRRRLRLLCRAGAPFHERRTYLWALSVIPQLPLAVLPLPNVPVYYTVWRVWSHRCAAAGARALGGALDAAGDVQRYELAARLADLQAGGFALRPGEWPAEMVAGIGRLKEAADAARARGGGGAAEGGAAEGGAAEGDAAEGGEAAAGDGTASGSSSGSAAASSSGSTGAGGGGAEGGAAAPPVVAQQWRERPKDLPIPVFIPDSFLEEVVQPKARWSTPLDEAAIDRIAEKWRQDNLSEHFEAAHRRCMPQEGAQ